jgi:hypothetical protein
VIATDQLLLVGDELRSVLARERELSAPQGNLPRWVMGAGERRLGWGCRRGAFEGEPMIVDEGVFDPNEHGEWGQYVMIYCSDPVSAERAIRKANLRLMLVSTDGVEYTMEDIEENEDLDEELLASYVGKPEVSPQGASFYIDTKMGTTPGAAAAYFRIVSEELMAAGVDTARVGAPAS